MEDSKLPVGIDSFRTIRETGLRYVDKTGFAAQLVKDGRRYFLSRPRKFGKSLFVRMLKELFEGNEMLFGGLAIRNEWDWTIRYPVINLTFSGRYDKENALEKRISEMLDTVERLTELSTTATTLTGRFSELISKLARKTGQQVVILMDESDKPIIDAISNPKLAKNNREVLQELFSALNDEDENIRFCFVTGISQFSLASIFWDTYHLRDITLLPEFSSICGYTESDLDHVFPDELAGLNREEIRDWYGGYCWLGNEKVYNPFGILQLFKERTYVARRHGSDALELMVGVMEQRGVLPITLIGLEISDRELVASDMDMTSTGSLLLQTGYMTIVEENQVGGKKSYKMDHPNREVRQIFHQRMLESLLQ